jgi:hypothetical protein
MVQWFKWLNRLWHLWVIQDLIFYLLVIFYKLCYLGVFYDVRINGKIIFFGFQKISLKIGVWDIVIL